MCHQTVGLVQKYLEENNIICSTISIVDEITRKLKTKTYLSVPYDLGSFSYTHLTLPPNREW